MSTGAMGSGCRISGHELAPPGEGKSACYPPQLWQSQPFDNLRPRKPLYLSPEGERASPAPFEAPSFFLRRGKNERTPSTALQAFRTGFDKLTACSRGGGGEQVRSRLAALTPQHCPQLRGGGDDLVGDRFQLDVGEALRMRLQFDLDRQAELPVGDAGPREAVEQARIDDACLVGTADRANEVGGRQALGGEEGEVAAHRLQRRRCESRACRAARALRGNRVEEDLHRHQIGIASCRERVCTTVEISVGAVS